MNWEIWIWVGIFVVSVLIELTTMELVTAWFAAGAIIPFVLALCNVPLWVQLVVFIVVSLALLLSMRKWALRLLKNSQGTTNLELIINTEHTLIKEIVEGEGGEIKINGIVWTAKTRDRSSIEAGALVKIKEVRGNHLVVSKGE